ncbi:MAG: cytochrome b/b6 domain-containing protein [Hyphomicrobiales bacterium]
MFWGEEWIEDIHEILVNGTLVLIALHVVGVAVASFEHKENLVKSMITGRKRRN